LVRAHPFRRLRRRARISLGMTLCIRFRSTRVPFVRTVPHHA
jgi:hypothetical protein